MSGRHGVHPASRAADLVGLFASPPAAFGTISCVSAAAVPEPFRSLLDHESHMTVAMERHHGGPVTLRVVAESAAPDGRYAREILLVGPAGRVVQFGIVRIDLRAVDATTAARIRAAAEPLGRILLDAGVLCSVGDVALLEITPGPHLMPFIGPQPTFGRVAAITLDGRAAIELLEIAAGG